MGGYCPLRLRCWSRLWTESKERLALLKALEPIVESMHAYQVTGLEKWFALNRRWGEVDVPPWWKQALAVLFALYLTVMVLNFLSPLCTTFRFQRRCRFAIFFRSHCRRG